jgi:hypothetical protein
MPRDFAAQSCACDRACPGEHALPLTWPSRVQRDFVLAVKTFEWIGGRPLGNEDLLFFIKVYQRFISLIFITPTLL